VVGRIWWAAAAAPYRHFGDDLTVIACLQRLGCVAAKRRLDDLDWRDGTVTVRGKGNRSDRLPPPVDVGTLVADYLTEGRPDTAAHRCSSGPGPELGRTPAHQRGGTAGAARTAWASALP
jgi:hypothetical protein